MGLTFHFSESHFSYFFESVNINRKWKNCISHSATKDFSLSDDMLIYNRFLLLTKYFPNISLNLSKLKCFLKGLIKWCSNFPQNPSKKKTTYKSNKTQNSTELSVFFL